MKIRNVLLVIFAIALGGLLFYAISPLFQNTKVDELLPEGQLIAEQMQVDEQMPKANFASEPAEIQGTTLHQASGTARIVESEGVNYLRYENFKTINGPDIFVYLSKDLEANEFVNLGKVRATEGNINYEIPADVDPGEYPYALVWCKQFDVLFNSAKLY